MYCTYRSIPLLHSKTVHNVQHSSFQWRRGTVYFDLLCWEQYATHDTNKIFFLYTAEHFAVSASFSARNSALFQVQYPSLLEHYTTQTNLLVVKGYLTRTYNILFHKEQEKYSIHVHWEHTQCANFLHIRNIHQSPSVLESPAITALLPTGNSILYTALLLWGSEFTSYSIQFHALSRNTAYSL
jgi:hypothetical protein